MFQLLFLLHFFPSGIFQIAFVFFLRPAAFLCRSLHLLIRFFQCVQFFFIFLQTDFQRRRFVFAEYISNQPLLISPIIRLFFRVILLYFRLHTADSRTLFQYLCPIFLSLFFFLRDFFINMRQLLRRQPCLFLLLTMLRFIIHPQRIPKLPALSAVILLLLVQYGQLLLILRTFGALFFQLLLLPGTIE